MILTNTDADAQNVQTFKYVCLSVCYLFIWVCSLLEQVYNCEGCVIALPV